MKVVFSWLREFCDPGISAEDAAELLTRHTVAVEAVEHPWKGLSGVVAATVVDKRRHPRSDRLVLAELDTGSRRAQVAAGVGNFEPGDVVPYAPPGARVPALVEPLRVRELRGERSEGMICSPSELAIGQDHSRILILPSGVRAGTDVKSWLGLEDEAVIELDLEPNRPDLLSVIGTARELSAVSGAPFTPRRPSPRESDERTEDAARLEVLDPGACPRFVGRVLRGVSLVASPLWAQARLSASGMRAVSAVVDATNYVMLEMGQPMHPYDLDLLAGKGLVVRRATELERVVTLDGVERILTVEDLVIADEERAVGVAGVMGSTIAEVSERTRDVLLESASFEAAGILRTSRRLGLRTEASVRFERGVDPESPSAAADRALELMIDWSGGTLLAGALEAGSAPPRRRVGVRPSRASLVVGERLDKAQVTGSLRRLQLDPVHEGERVIVEVPGYRHDLTREIDLIEEVARIHGYDAVVSSLPKVRQVGGLTREQSTRWRLRDVLSGAGLFEARSTSFLSDSQLGLYLGRQPRTVRIANPVSDETPHLRPALLPGLVSAVRRNLDSHVPAVRLFELGAVWTRAPVAPVEEERVSAVLAGASGQGWPAERRELDFFDVKGVLEVLLESIGVGEWRLESPGASPFHPGRSARVILGGIDVGVVGELHPQVLRRIDVPVRIAAFELAVPSLLAATARDVRYRALPRFPAVHRDLAFTVDVAAAAADVEAVIREAAGALLDTCALFDVFEGHPVPEGKKSLAFSLSFRAADRTLTAKEVDAVVGVVADRLRRELGAELRTE